MTTPNAFISPQTPKSWTAVCTAAETAFNAPTAIQTLIDESVDTSQKRITSLYAIARAAVGTACNCQLYKKVGTTYTLIASVVMAIGTPSASVANQSADFGYSEDFPLVLSSTEGLVVATGQAITNGIAFRAHGGTY